MFTDKRFFCDSYMREEEGGYTFVYRTGMLAFVEALRGGSLYAIDYNGAGYSPHCTTIPAIPQMNMNDFTDNAFAFELCIDGQRMHSHWEFIDYGIEEFDKGIIVTVTLKHAVRPITLLVKTKLDGTGILCRWLEIKNTGANPAAISAISVMSGALNTTLRYKNHLRNGSSLYRLGYMEDFRWGHEGDFRWHDVIEGGQYFTSRYGRERYRHPIFMLENRATGGIFIGQLAYSGGYRFDFDFNGLNADAHLSYKASIDGYTPIRVLDAEETTVTPEMHLGYMFGGIDAAVNEMNRHIRRSVMKYHRGDVRIAPQETGIGPEMDMRTEAIMASIDAAAGRGSDIFFIDASWYCPADRGEDDWINFVGDWFPEKIRYTKSIDELREYAHSKGVKFGLWMEPERMGVESKVFKEHPEYCTEGYDGRILGECRGGGGMIDLSKTEAANWVEEQITKMLETYKVDLFRLDYNVGQKCTRSFVRRGDYLESSEYRYYENWYGIFDRLRQRFPNVVFEGCASGGGRTDLGMVSRLSHTWVTDWQFAPRSFEIINGLSMCLPPELIDRLCGGQNNHTLAEVDFQMGLLMFGRPSVGMINPDSYCIANPILMDRVNHFIALYNETVRPMHESGSKIYHHTPDLGGDDPQGNGILELTNEDGTSAILGVFALSDPETDTVKVRFRGLDISKKYELKFDNQPGTTKISGYALMNTGVNVTLPSAFVSQLLIVKAVD